MNKSRFREEFVYEVFPPTEVQGIIIELGYFCFANV